MHQFSIDRHAIVSSNTPKQTNKKNIKSHTNDLLRESKDEMNVFDTVRKIKSQKLLTKRSKNSRLGSLHGNLSQMVVASSITLDLISIINFNLSIASEYLFMSPGQSAAAA